MFLRFAIEDVFQRVANHIWDHLEVGDLVGNKRGAPSVVQWEHARERRLYALNPSLMGFPICMFSRQTDGPCCPMYSLLSSLGGEDSASASASVMATSPSRATGRKPYDVGMIAFGVSSPAYPARSVDVPMSSTRAETSSGRAECQRQARNPLLYREHTTSVLHHPGWLVEMCSGIPIGSKIRFSTVRIIFQKHSRFRPTKEKG